MELLFFVVKIETSISISHHSAIFLPAQQSMILKSIYSDLRLMAETFVKYALKFVPYTVLRFKLWHFLIPQPGLNLRSLVNCSTYIHEIVLLHKALFYSNSDEIFENFIVLKLFENFEILWNFWKLWNFMKILTFFLIFEIYRICPIRIEIIHAGNTLLLFKYG